MPPPLPGGYKVGEKVFFTGASMTYEDGDKLVHGGQGEVKGPATHEDYKGKGVVVLFSCYKTRIECLLAKVRRLRAVPLPPPPACAPHARRCPYLDK